MSIEHKKIALIAYCQACNGWAIVAAKSDIDTDLKERQSFYGKVAKRNYSVEQVEKDSPEWTNRFSFGVCHCNAKKS